MRAGTLLKSTLDTKTASYACIFIAIINKSLIAWLYSSLKADKALYLLFTQGLLQTGVMGEPVSVFENGQHVYRYDPAVYSPLYSLLCAPLLELTHSFFATQYLLSVAGFVLLFSGLYKTARAFFTSRWQANLFVLGAGFFLYPFELLSVAKDVLAAGFSIWGLVLLRTFYTQTPAAWRTALLALCIAGLCLVKLLYIPIGLTLLALLFAVSLEKKSGLRLLHAGACLALVFLLGAAAETFVFGPARELAQRYPLTIPGTGEVTVKGFFPRNLLLAQPFLTASVINVNFWGVQWQRMTSVPYLKTISLFRMADAALLLFLLVYALGRLKRIWRDKLLFSLIAAAFSVTAAVLYLSLSLDAVSYKSSSNRWAYVSDVRSFFVPMLTLQLVLLRFVFTASRALWLRCVLCLLLAFECVHGLYFTARQMLSLPLSPEANVTTEAGTKLLAVLRRSADAGRPLALVTSDKFLRRYAQVHFLPAYSFTDRPADLSWIKKGKRFLIAVHRADTGELKKFPASSLLPADTLEPYVLRFYEKK